MKQCTQQQEDKPPRSKQEAGEELCAAEITNGWGLLSYLRMRNRLPGEPTPRPEGWTLAPQPLTSKEGAEAEG